ncbi:MAG: glycosyltransferase family 2 protein [Aeromicrobium erythreum]
MEDEVPVRPWLADPPTVGAVLVVHHGGRWLPKVLASFAQMDVAPTAWRVVDVASSDRGADLVRESFGPDRVLYAGSGTGFGEAVRRGIEALPPTDWVWLLHDDAAVTPDTLAGLLDEATTADDVAVVGPKIREWPSLRRLLEVGLTITSTGARETGLETGEPDAGQHDWAEDVLAVSSAGMLVRRSVWDELGGFDPDLPLFFDDIDFGWRVALAGYRTRTAPNGVIFHAEASRRGSRPRTAGDPEPWEARRAALHTILTNTRGLRLPWAALRLAVGTLLRVLGYLVAKDPEAAGDELVALREVYGRPGRLRAARRRKAATVRRRHRDVKHLLAPAWLPYRHGLDAIREVAVALVRPETIETTGRRSTLGDTAPDEAEDLDDGPPLWRRRPWLVTVLLLVLGSFVSAGGLVGLGSPLVGGALPPTPETTGAWWQLMVGRTPDVGLGSTDFPPTYAGLLALLGVPVWFSPGLVVTVLLLFCVPLAAMTAHRLGRLLTPRRGPRIVWAVGYGLAVAATGAVQQGRLGTVVALVVLPVVVNTALQLHARPGRQLALRLGLWVAVAGAFAPVVVPMVLVALAVLAARRLLAAVDAAVVAAVALVLLGPWTVGRALRPWRTWWEAGYPVPGRADALDVVLGRAGSLGAPAWLTVPVIVLAVLALLPTRSRGTVVRCWAVALGGLVTAVVGTLVTFGTGGGARDLTAWVAVPAVVWFAGLATAVLMAAVDLDLRSRPAAAGLALVALVMPVGAALWWLSGPSGAVDRAEPSVVPAYLTQRPGSTLVLTGSLDDGVRTRVVAGDGPFLGQEALEPPRDRAEELDAAVARLLTRPSPDDVATLARLGVGAVYAPDADPGVADRVDAAPGVEQAGSDRPGSRVWTLDATPRRPEVSAPVWHPLVTGLQGVVWVVAVVMTAPVRRRPVVEDVPEDVDPEPVRIAP